jgi:hypothetical protein
VTRMTIDLQPRFAVTVDVQDSTVIETDVARARGKIPAHGVVLIGGGGAGAVRITGSPGALRRLAGALSEAANVERGAKSAPLGRGAQVGHPSGNLPEGAAS